MAVLSTFLLLCAVLRTEQAVAPLQPPLSNNELGTIIILLYLKKLRHKGFSKGHSVMATQTQPARCQSLWS